METADEKITREAFMIVLANASKYGTGAVINPEGSINDGFFELVILKRINMATTLKMLVNPGPYNTKHIEIFKCKTVNIHTKRKVPFQIDGEYIGKVKDIRASISHRSLQVILPNEEG